MMCLVLDKILYYNIICDFNKTVLYFTLLYMKNIINYLTLNIQETKTNCFQCMDRYMNQQIEEWTEIKVEIVIQMDFY